MNKLNSWIEKAGVDRLLHFFVAAWIVAECKAYGIGAACVGWVLVVVLSFVKEEWMDAELNTKDLVWGVCGGFVSLILAAAHDVIV